MVTREDVEAAAERIAPHVRRTPILELAAGELCPVPVTLKLEQLQHTGSFKARGAFNRLLKLGAVTPVVAASGGNHGAAVSYAARKLGSHAEVFVPAYASAAKVKRIEDFGGVVKAVEGDFGDVVATSERRAAETGFPLVHAYDDPDVIEGQGTATLEFRRQAMFDTVLIAVGGGGLAGGAVAALDGAARVIAVETEGTPTYRNARNADAPVTTKVGGLAADALGAHIMGANAFAILKSRDVESLLVPDEDVLAAQNWLWSRCRIATEAGGATALAAVLAGAYRPDAAERIGVIVCGANTDLAWAR